MKDRLIKIKKLIKDKFIKIKKIIKDKFKLIKKIDFKNKKTIIIASIILVVGIIGLILLNRGGSNNNLVDDDGKPIIENIEVESKDEITVVSSRIEKLNKSSSIFVKVKNDTKETIDKTALALNIYDKNNKVL